MNKEDIIRMAREAGFYCTTRQSTLEGMIERFAAIVAAAEREACAKVCEAQKLKYEKRAEEPEEFRDINPEVARIAGMTCDFNAAAIRARGQA